MQKMISQVIFYLNLDQTIKPQMPSMMGMGINPAMFGMQGMQGMPPGMNPFGQGMMSGMTPMAIQGPNGTMMVMMPNLMGPQGQPQNPNSSQTSTGNSSAQIPGMGIPPGFALPPSMANLLSMGINPFNPTQGNPSSGDKNQNPIGMTQNPMMMGMMPQMMNPAILNQLMQ